MYKPFPEELTIRSSNIHGVGLFSTRRIPKGTVLGTSHLKHVQSEDGWIRTPLGGFYNHSENPNCILVDGYYGIHEHRMECKTLITMKDIQNGEELTCCYTIYPFSDIIKEEPKFDWLGL